MEITFENYMILCNKLASVRGTCRAIAAVLNQAIYSNAGEIAIPATDASDMLSYLLDAASDTRECFEVLEHSIK